MMNENLLVAIIGGGPIGLAASAQHQKTNCYFQFRGPQNR